ncbi:MAG: hypothetical protein AMJ84_09440 [Acidithiobacillales bacterium SM23_46]|jgi:drug/metabolite transporter (DMT)-like permease|nr:MAG: hypothetical protein AMJ84_09440 [Acidithiobacillales bacterium SM23_46]
MPSIETHRTLAVLSLLAGATLWGVIWYPMRLLEGEGLSGLWLTLILYGTALVASLPRTWRCFAEFRHHPWLMALLMLAAGWTNIAFVEAVLGGNILRVLLLFYLSPLWATLLGWWWLGERLSRLAWMSLVIAMSGAMLMLWNPALGLPLPQGTAEWMALSSGMAFALSIVTTRRVEAVSVWAKAAAVWLGVVVLAAIIMTALQLPRPPIGLPVFGGAALLGLFGILLMTLMVQYGVTHLPVQRSAVIVLVELIAGAVSQQLLTDEIVTVREWAGGALIAFGAYLAARLGRV